MTGLDLGLALAAAGLFVLYVVQLTNGWSWVRAARSWQDAYQAACASRDRWESSSRRWERTAGQYFELYRLARLADVSRETLRRPLTGADHPDFRFVPERAPDNSYAPGVEIPVDPVANPVDGGDDDGGPLFDEPAHFERGPEPGPPEWS